MTIATHRAMGGCFFIDTAYGDHICGVHDVFFGDSSFEISSKVLPLLNDGEKVFTTRDFTLV